MPQHAAALAALQTAIMDGDFEASIFEDANCMRYLLYLMESKKIPFWQGMTTYGIYYRARTIYPF